MFAVVETGGKQYRVRVGQTLDVDCLPSAPGETVELGRVLMVGESDHAAIGRPTVPGAKVMAKVIGDVRGPHIIVFKYKSKVRYRRKIGHRQPYTRVAIREIVPGSA
jgi:large subunit ribosomal protein L21